MTNRDDTIFDKIIRGEIPCQKVFEDETVLAFKDINPQAPVHVLVIPKKKIRGFSNFAQMTSDEAGRYIQAVAKVATHLNLDANGYRVVFNCGKHGQQTVD